MPKRNSGSSISAAILPACSQVSSNSDEWCSLPHDAPMRSPPSANHRSGRDNYPTWMGVEAKNLDLGTLVSELYIAPSTYPFSSFKYSQPSTHPPAVTTASRSAYNCKRILILLSPVELPCPVARGQSCLQEPLGSFLNLQPLS